MTTTTTTDSVRLRMEISFIGPESALSDLTKPANFLFVLGHDTNGRPSKAVFHGAYARRLRDDLAKMLEGSDIATRRPAIEAHGSWGFSKEPRKKNGEVVKDASGKPVHDRQFQANAQAQLLAGPPLEVFRSQRAAMRHLKAAAKLDAEIEAAEKAGDLATALAKAKAAKNDMASFLQKLAQRGGTTAAPADEYQAVVAAATDGAVTESLSAEPAPAEPEAARPIPETSETAPAVKQAPAPRAAGIPSRVGGFGLRRRQPTQPAPETPAANSEAPATKGEAPRSEPASAEADKTSEAPAAETAVEAATAAPSTESSDASARPDPEAAAEARFAKSGKDFVDADGRPAAPELKTETPAPTPAPARPAPRRIGGFGMLPRR